MGAALIGLALASGVSVFLLAVPVRLAFSVRGIEVFRGEVAIAWLFGSVRWRAELPAGPRPSQSPQRKVQRAPRPRAQGAPRRAPARVLALLRDAAFRQRVRRLLGDIVRAAHVHDLALRLRFGLGDPADTGRLWGVLAPLLVATPLLRNESVRIAPDFADAVLDFEARGALRLIPLQLLALAIAFVLSPASIRAWLTLSARHG